MTKVSKLGEFKVEFNLNDVVNVFVSRYEKGLFEKKATINTNLTIAKKDLEDYERKVESKLNREIEEDFKKQWDFTTPNPLFKVKYTKGVLRNWEDGVLGYLEFDVINSDSYKGNMNVSKRMKIGEEELKNLKSYKEIVNSLKVELGEVMVQISQISTKEREIRGLISEKNLKEIGMESVLLDNDILRLIE